MPIRNTAIRKPLLAVAFVTVAAAAIVARLAPPG